MKTILSVIVLALVLTGCNKNCKCDIPPPNEFVVADPEPTPELNLNTIDWQVWNQSRLAQEGAKTENKDKVFFVLTQEQANLLFDNLNKVSDAFSKSIATNKYWQKAVDDYRAKTAETNKKDGK